jgi:hypothetical protein
MAFSYKRTSGPERLSVGPFIQEPACDRLSKPRPGRTYGANLRDSNENRPEIGEPKCIQKPRRSFIGHPDAMWFSPNSGKWSFSTATPDFDYDVRVRWSCQIGMGYLSTAKIGSL